MVMLKTMIGLGVLGIPSALDTLGIVPGVIIICTIATIITWSDYIVGTFKQRHPTVYGIDDAMGLIFGRWGREIYGAIFCICESTRDNIRRFLTTDRLDILRRVWYPRSFDFFKRDVHSWHMHCGLCHLFCNFGIHAR